MIAIDIKQYLEKITAAGDWVSFENPAYGSLFPYFGYLLSLFRDIVEGCRLDTLFATSCVLDWCGPNLCACRIFQLQSALSPSCIQSHEKVGYVAIFAMWLDGVDKSNVSHS